MNPTAIQSRRPYPAIGDVLAQYPIGISRYNALQAKLEKRFSGGAFQASYTWSKSLDLLSTDGGNVANGLDPRRNYGPSDFDRTHQLTLSYTYELPFGQGRKLLNHDDVFSKYVLGGWQLNGITSFASGQPFGVLENDKSNTGGNHTFYADRVCNGNRAVGERTQLKWFDTSCCVQPALGTRAMRAGTSCAWGGSRTGTSRYSRTCRLGRVAHCNSARNSSISSINTRLA